MAVQAESSGRRRKRVKRPALAKPAFTRLRTPASLAHRSVAMARWRMNVGGSCSVRAASPASSSAPQPCRRACATSPLAYAMRTSPRCSPAASHYYCIVLFAYACASCKQHGQSRQQRALK